MKSAFFYHSLRRDISNFSLIKHRAVDGFLISMHQSGTHWLKHILATALTHKFGLPPPQYIHANDVIPGPKDPRGDSKLPYIVSSHSIPHALIGSRLFRQFVKLPPYVILVRDIRASLVSTYEKWKNHYDCDFPVFLRGDVSGHQFHNDIWWCLRFCNRWGLLAHRFPETTLVIKYEDLKSRPLVVMQSIVEYWDLGLDESSLRFGLEESSKEKMAEKSDPGSEFNVTVIRNNKRSFMEWYDEEQLNYIGNICANYLKYDFGYEYRKG